MEKSEYDSKLAELHKEFDLQRKELAEEFAFSNAKYKEGDILEGSTGIMKVEKLRCNIIYDKVDVLYVGYELKKDLTPKKSQEILYIHGNKGVIRAIKIA